MTIFKAVRRPVLAVAWSTVMCAVVCGQQPDFQPRQVVDKQPTITAAPFASAVQADHDLNPSELIIGVTLGDAARAYPLNMLTGPSREIINDVIGSTPIAATW